MGKSKDVSAITVAQMVVLGKEGLSQREIRDRLNIKSQSTVQRCLKRYQETNSFCAKKRPPRQRITTAATDRWIRRRVVADPYISATAIRHELSPNISVSSRTIRRRLSNEMGLKSFKAASKPKLSAKNRRDRIAFCERHRHWSPEDWHSVMFSDETTINQFCNFQKRVRRLPGERYNEKYTTGSVKFSAKIMIWGSIAATGRGSLWIAPPKSTIKVANYLSILQDKLPTMMPLRNCTIFQQDGAPCHTARMVTQWIHQQDFQLLEGWPGNSPDLNPIENCWSLLKNRVAELQPTGTADLIEKIKIVWSQQISPDYCRQLLD